MRDADAKREFRRAMQRSRIALDPFLGAGADRDFKIFQLGVAYGYGQAEQHAEHDMNTLYERMKQSVQNVEDIT